MRVSQRSESEIPAEHRCLKQYEVLAYLRLAMGVAVSLAAMAISISPVLGENQARTSSSEAQSAPRAATSTGSPCRAAGKD
jgi:hypothetical protein